MTRAYATGTRVSVEKTRSEIAGMLGRFGASHYAFGTEPGHDIVAFRLSERQFRFTVMHPTWEEVAKGYKDPSRVLDRKAAVDGELARRWRARLLWLKATLEFVGEEGADPAEYLLPFLMLPDGTTMGEWAANQIERMYSTGKMPPLLGSGRG